MRDKVNIDKTMVSVIMPCYNDGAYIEESIRSVWAQTYQNLELIVIDDGSDDKKTLDILKDIAENERCKVLHGNHGGPSAARNYGIKQACGKYILPLDSDDTIEPTYIEKAVHAIEEKPERGVVYCYADLFGEATGRWNLPAYSFEKMIVDNIVFITALFLREDWERVGGFNVNMVYGMEDYDFWISILELGKEIYQIPETLFHYRIKSKSRTTRLMSSIDDTQKMYEMIYDTHPQFYSRYRDLYAKCLRNTLIEQIFLRNQLTKACAMLEKLKKNPIVRYIYKHYIQKRGECV